MEVQVFPGLLMDLSFTDNMLAYLDALSKYEAATESNEAVQLYVPVQHIWEILTEDERSKLFHYFFLKFCLNRNKKPDSLTGKAPVSGTGE